MGKAEDKHVNKVGDKGTDDAGDQRVALKVLAVEDFDASNGGAQRRAKNGAQAPGRSRQEQYAALRGRQAQTHRQPTAQTRTDLNQRPFAPGRSTRGQRNNSRQRFDRRDDWANHTALVVEGIDHRIGTRPFGFGRQAMSDIAAEQTTQSR